MLLVQYYHVICHSSFCLYLILFNFYVHYCSSLIVCHVFLPFLLLFELCLYCLSTHLSYTIILSQFFKVVSSISHLHLFTFFQNNLLFFLRFFCILLRRFSIAFILFTYTHFITYIKDFTFYALYPSFITFLRRQIQLLPPNSLCLINEHP